MSRPVRGPTGGWHFPGMNRSSRAGPKSRHRITSNPASSTCASGACGGGRRGQMRSGAGARATGQWFFRRSTRWRACRTGSTGTDLLRRRCAPRACIWRCSRSVSVLGIEPLIAACAARGDARKSEPSGSMNPGRLSRVDRRLPLVGAADPTLIWNRHSFPTDSVSRPSALPGTHGPGLWITAA